MSNALKIPVQGLERQTILQLIRAERQAIKTNNNKPVSTKAQERAIDFYNDHLRKLEKKLDPNNKYIY